MLNPYLFLCLVVFVYVLGTDSNVAPFLILQSKRLNLWVARKAWMARYHPGTPWMRWSIARRADKLAKELQQSFNSVEESEVG